MGRAHSGWLDQDDTMSLYDGVEGRGGTGGGGGSGACGGLDCGYVGRGRAVGVL